MNYMHLDPTIIQAARKIYRAYLNIYTKLQKKPFGVVINCKTFRGQLIFREQPILLPEEYFIPVSQIEAQI